MLRDTDKDSNLTIAWRECVNEECQAVSILYKKFDPKLMQYCTWTLNLPYADAQDVALETWIQADKDIKAKETSGVFKLRIAEDFQLLPLLKFIARQKRYALWEKRTLPKRPKNTPPDRRTGKNIERMPKEETVDYNNTSNPVVSQLRAGKTDNFVYRAFTSLQGKDYINELA
jgi:hypothetical protein